MKFLVIQTPGRNPANIEFGRGWQRALIAAGHEIIEYGPAQKDCAPPKADIILHLVDYHGQWVPCLSKRPETKVAVFMDSHLNYSGTLESCISHKFDYIITNVKDSEKNYCRYARKKSLWFPNAYDPSLVKKLDIPKIHPCGFCGSLANRADWLAILQSAGLWHDIGVIGDDMVKCINGYKIHWNRNISFDLNCRTFETTGCGTMLLTNETAGLKECFGIGTQVVTYTDRVDCADKIKYYATHDKEREEIAAAGHKQAYEQHSYSRRVEQLLEVIG